jgi:hypothetical protein
MKVPLNPPLLKGEELLPFFKGGGEGLGCLIFSLLEGELYEL